MEYPRLLYRGPEDETAETLKVDDAAAAEKAQAAGWRLRRTHDPALKPAAKTAKAAETAETPGAPSVLDGSVVDVSEHVADVTDVRTLQDLRAQEVKGKNRRGALDAIDARIAELKG